MAQMARLAKLFMWVPYLCSFPGNEAHQRFFWGPRLGRFGVGASMHVKKVYVLFEPGWPRFSSVRLQFVHGTVRVVPVFGSDGSSGERVSWYLSSILTERHGSGSGFAS